MGTEVMVPDESVLRSLLREAGTAVIELAAEHGVGPDFPIKEYLVRWMEWIGEGRSEGREEARQGPSFSALALRLGDKLLQLPQVEALISNAASYARAKGKF